MGPNRETGRRRRFQSSEYSKANIVKWSICSKNNGPIVHPGGDMVEILEGLLIPIEGLKRAGEALFPRVSRNRTRGNGFKLNVGRLN